MVFSLLFVSICCCCSNTLATWCEELTHLKRPWCWERLKAEGEGHDRGWDGWMVSLTRWTWVWASSGRWWRTEKPGVLQFMGLQRAAHHWGTEQQQSTKLYLVTFLTSSSPDTHSTRKTIQLLLYSFKKKTNWGSKRNCFSFQMGYLPFILISK